MEIMLDLISASEMSLRTLSQSCMLLFSMSVSFWNCHLLTFVRSSVPLFPYLAAMFYFVYDRFLYHLKETFIITLLAKSIPWNNFVGVVNIKLASLLLRDNKMPWIEVEEKSSFKKKSKRSEETQWYKGKNTTLTVQIPRFKVCLLYILTLYDAQILFFKYLKCLIEV